MSKTFVSTALAVVMLSITGCGGGGDSSPAIITIPPTIPPVVVEPPVVIEPPVVPPVVGDVQMSKPTECLTDATATGFDTYEFITCDGILVQSDIDFPYEPGNKEMAIIDMLAVVDTKLDVELDGGTYEEFAQRELDLANKLFADSGVYVKLRLAGVQLVEVDVGSLYKQIDRFSRGQREFSDLDEWQRDAEADIAYLFKKIEEVPIACGVAIYEDLTQEYKYRRGVGQCHINTVFQETEVTRYYERAHETFTHEIGHILGMDHNIESAGAPSTLFPHSYGYLIPGYNRNLSDEYNGYGTIMSYSDLPVGRFSDRSGTFIIPENGESRRMGRDRQTSPYIGGDTMPATDGVDHINRVRYYMSQLHEMFNGPDASPAIFNAQTTDAHICLF